MTSDRLVILREEVAVRTEAISGSMPNWPCRKGCDHCCHHLACLPELVEDEWASVEEGLARLDSQSRQHVEARLQRLSEGARPPHVCPFLDDSAGSCRIYAHRPMACRTYGFYVERGVGSYCGIIRERVESGEYAQVVWGNHEAVDGRLERMGAKIPMREWVQRRLAIR
jgi:Fe-S-cluster containining protein